METQAWRPAASSALAHSQSCKSVGAWSVAFSSTSCWPIPWQDPHGDLCLAPQAVKQDQFLGTDFLLNGTCGGWIHWPRWFSNGSSRGVFSLIAQELEHLLSRLLVWNTAPAFQESPSATRLHQNLSWHSSASTKAERDMRFTRQKLASKMLPRSLACSESNFPGKGKSQALFLAPTRLFFAVYLWHWAQSLSKLCLAPRVTTENELTCSLTSASKVSDHSK